MKKLICTLITGAIAAAALTGCGSSGNNLTSGDITGEIYPITREEGSGTRSAFAELFEIVDADGNDAITETAESTSSTSVMMTTVAGNKNSIGYVSLGSLSKDVKPVNIDGVECTAENVENGSYKISRPFNVCYPRGGLSQIARDFVKYIVSSDGQALVEEEGYIPIDTGENYSPGGQKGTVTLAGSTSVAPVMNVLADAYKALNPGVTVEIQESGSTAGIQSVTEGAVDIGMSSRDLEEEEEKALVSQKLALDGIAVIVNKGNPVRNISSKTVRSIYLAEITAWEDVGNGTE